MRVVGLDVGTSAIKAVRFRLGETASVEAVASLQHPLQVGAPGRAEQDPDEALRLTVQVLRGLDDWDGVKAIGVSAAMHSLLALDPAHRPLSSAWTWADLRATAEARELSEADPRLAERSGTPVHPMAWPAKLLWMQRHQGEMFGSAHRFCGLKEYLLHRLTGASLVMDRSMASATGCYNLRAGTWEGQGERFPAIVETRAVVGELSIPGLPSIPVVAGAGDGPLSNLGSGATDPRLPALSIGTSGAIRVVVSQAAGDARGRIFCYHLDQGYWVRGGAISNGTLALDWLRELLGGVGGNAELVSQGCAHSSDGLLFLPYLAGERAPHWNPAARGVLFGLGLHHGRPQMIRAVLEGVAFALRDVLEALELEAVQQIRASGGLTGSPEWMQLLTDVLEVPVATVVSPEAAALGAALLAARAVGVDTTPDLRVQRVYDPKVSYREPFRRYQQLYPALQSHFQ